MKDNNTGPVTNFGRAFFPLAIAATLVLLVGVWVFLNPFIAVKGGYVFLGLVGAGVVYYGEDLRQEIKFTSPQKQRQDASGRIGGKATVIFVAVGIGAAGFVTSRLPILLFVIPIGYSIVGVQIARHDSPRWILAQVCGLFYANALSKFLATGFYFGAGDTLVHVRWIELIMRGGNIASIASVYKKFPGLHLNAGTLSFITGLDPYESLLLIGITFYALSVLPSMYLLVRLNFSRTLALLAVAVVSALDTVIFYSTYVFPQSVGIGIGIVVLYLAYRASHSDGADQRSIALSATVLIIALVFIHHVTFFLLLLLIMLLTVGDSLNDRFRSCDVKTVHYPRALPLLVGTIAAIGYWSIVAEEIVRTVYWGVFVLLWRSLELNSGPRSVTVGGAGKETLGGTISGPVALGTTLPQKTLATAAESLATAPGLYYALLAMLFVLGVVTTIENHRLFGEGLAMLCVGVLGGMVMFKTPIHVAAMNRLRHPLSFFTGVIAAVGLSRIIISGDQRRRVLAGLLLAALAISGTIVASNEVQVLDDGRTAQHSFSQTEYEQIGSAARFAKQYDAQMSTFWLSRTALHRFRTDAGSNIQVSERGFSVPAGMFLYRDAWATYRVKHETNSVGLQDVVVSDRWLRRSVSGSNAVYDSGRAGLVWGDTRWRFGPYGGNASSGGWS